MVKKTTTISNNYHSIFFPMQNWSLFVGCGRRRERYAREDRCGWEKKSRRQLRMQDAHERVSEMKEQVRIIPRSSDQMLYVRVKHGWSPNM